MKVIEISNKTYLVRHWFVWYRVQRGGAHWQKLQPIISSGKPAKEFTIENAAESLKKAGKSDGRPPIDLTN